MNKKNLALLVKCLGLLATTILVILVIVIDVIKEEVTETKYKVGFGLILAMFIVFMYVLKAIKKSINRKAQSIDVAHEMGVASKTSKSWIVVVDYMNVLIPLLCSGLLINIAVSGFQRAYEIIYRIAFALLPSMVTFIIGENLDNAFLKDKEIEEKENYILRIADEIEKRIVK